jgi:hypothetical protein
MQILEKRYRNRQQRQVCPDIDACVDVRNDVAVQARPRHFRIPVFLDGVACKDGAEDGPAAVDDKEADDSDEGLVDAWRAEDAVVLEGDGELAEDEGDVVERDRCPECLKVGVSGNDCACLVLEVNR